ncbi:unnamed protein product [Cuscuta campestris]|uniref:Uncharacterized protein n=1 Tax=Cuscuta campestris TaxID=132261 RepID=A0A484KEU9_9ASTE|nr:unnamed protein product [Cuscuta campestris]
MPSCNRPPGSSKNQSPAVSQASWEVGAGGLLETASLLPSRGKFIPFFVSYPFFGFLTLRLSAIFLTTPEVSLAFSLRFPSRHLLRFLSSPHTPGFSIGDPAFQLVDDDPDFVPVDVFEDVENHVANNEMVMTDEKSGNEKHP